MQGRHSHTCIEQESIHKQLLLFDTNIKLLLISQLKSSFCILFSFNSTTEYKRLIFEVTLRKYQKNPVNSKSVLL